MPAQPILSVDEFPITDGSTACIPLIAQIMADTTGLDLETAPERRGASRGVLFPAEVGSGESPGAFSLLPIGKRAKIPPTGFQTRSKRGHGRVRSVGLTAVL